MGVDYSFASLLEQFDLPRIQTVIRCDDFHFSRFHAWSDDRAGARNREASLNRICVHVKFVTAKHRRDWPKGRFSVTSGPSTKKIMAALALRLLALRSLFLGNREQGQWQYKERQDQES